MGRSLERFFGEEAVASLLERVDLRLGRQNPDLKSLSFQGSVHYGNHYGRIGGVAEPVKILFQLLH
jgi:hypothetical protein